MNCDTPRQYLNYFRTYYYLASRDFQSFAILESSNDDICGLSGTGGPIDLMFDSR